MDSDDAAVRQAARRARRLLLAPVAALLVAVAAGIALGVLVHPAGVGLALVGLIGLGARWRIQPADPSPDTGGLVLEPDAEPALWDEVRDLADRLGVEPPDEIVLAAGVTADLRHRTRGLGRIVASRHLVLGLPLFGMLTLDELRATIAWLLARDAELGVPDGPELCRVAVAGQAVLGRGPTGPFAEVRGRRLAAVVESAVVVRSAQIVAADGRAVELYGRTVVDGALRRMHLGEAAFDAFLNEYVVPLWSVGAYPTDMYEGLRRFGSADGRDEQFEALRLSTMLSDRPRNAGEPAVSTRIRLLQSAPGDDRIPDLGESVGLVTGRAEAEPALAAVLADEAFPGVEPLATTWAESPALVEVLERARAARLAAVAHEQDTVAVRAGGLAHVVRWVAAHPDQVAAGLAPELATLPEDGRDEVVTGVVRAYLRAAMGSALIDHAACHWALDWNGPHRLVGPDGREVNLDDWVDGVMGAHVGPRLVTDWLDRVGVPVSAG